MASGVPTLDLNIQSAALVLWMMYQNGRQYRYFVFGATNQMRALCLCQQNLTAVLVWSGLVWSSVLFPPGQTASRSLGRVTRLVCLLTRRILVAKSYASRTCTPEAVII